MLTIRLICAAAALAVLPSCEKTRELAGRARAAVLDKAPQERAADPVLAALVDRTDDGAIFRSDLPFPQQLEVRVTRKTELDQARIMQNSALGTEAALISGSHRTTYFYERIGQHVRMTLEEATFAPPEPPPGEEEDAAPAAAPAETSTSDLTGIALVFRRETGRWKADPNPDFRASGLAGQLTPAFHRLLEEGGAAPRPRWLAPRRIRPGDEIVMTGPDLAILFDGTVTGRVSLTLDSFENDAQGHPCGVFTISGDYKSRSVPAANGEKLDQDVSILSGKIWLSLVHPLILREDLETIQTTVAGAGGGPSVRVQGKTRVKTTREWTVKTPD